MTGHSAIDPAICSPHPRRRSRRTIVLVEDLHGHIKQLVSRPSDQMSPQASQTLLLRALVLLSVSSAAAAAVAVAVVASSAVTRRRRQATHDDEASQAKRAVEGGARILLAIDIGSSSVRCSAYIVGSPPLPVPGCAVQMKHAVVRDCGTADADEVVDLVDRAVDHCFG